MHESTISKLWNGDATDFPNWLVRLNKELQRQECSFIINTPGSVGHVPLEIDPAAPMAMVPGFGGMVAVDPRVRERYEDTCRRNRESNRKLQSASSKGCGIIYDMLGEVAMTAVENIRDDTTLTDKQKGERIIPALQAFFVGNSAVVRKEMFAKLEAIREVRDCVTAREAIKTIDQVNAQLALQVNALTGLADHFMQPDADKIEKYLELLQGSSVFEKSIDFLERKRDDDDLTWDQLKAEIHKQCRNIDLKEKGQNLKVSQVKTRVGEEEIERRIAEGVAEGIKQAAGYRDSRDGRGRDNSRESSRGRDSWRRKESDYGRGSRNDRRDDSRGKEYGRFGRDNSRGREDNRQQRDYSRDRGDYRREESHGQGYYRRRDGSRSRERNSYNERKDRDDTRQASSSSSSKKRDT
jgi:hypothetical protein